VKWRHRQRVLTADIVTLSSSLPSSSSSFPSCARTVPSGHVGVTSNEYEEMKPLLWKLTG